jgi:hypothetical protein
VVHRGTQAFVCASALTLVCLWLSSEDLKCGSSSGNSSSSGSSRGILQTVIDTTHVLYDLRCFVVCRCVLRCFHHAAGVCCVLRLLEQSASRSPIATPRAFDTNSINIINQEINSDTEQNNSMVETCISMACELNYFKCPGQ